MDPTFLIVVAVIFFSMGALIAGLVQGLRNSRKERSGEEIPDPFPEGTEEMLRLWRRDVDGTLIPEVRGKRVEELDRLTVAQHTHILTAWLELKHWLESTRFPLPESARGGKGIEADSLPEGPPPKPLIKPVESFASSLPQPSTSLNPFTPFIKAARREGPEKPAGPDKSIAEQIDEILQLMLRGSQLQDQGIRVMDLPGKGVVILVNGRQYEGVEAVQDEEIRSVIQAAVAEWEGRALGNSLSGALT